MMQTAAGSDAPNIENPNYRSVVSDLITLAERIEASIKLLEQAISRELPCNNPEVHDNVFILDDVTPCYTKASAVLLACHVGLGEALHLMQGTPAFDADADRATRSRGRLTVCT